MQINQIVEIVCGAVLAICGLASIIKGKLVALNMDAYTEESNKKFSRPGGLMWILIGACMVCFALLDGTAFWVSLVVALVLLVIYVIMMRKMLVKKPRN